MLNNLKIFYIKKSGGNKKDAGHFVRLASQTGAGS